MKEKVCSLKDISQIKQSEAQSLCQRAIKSLCAYFVENVIICETVWWQGHEYLDFQTLLTYAAHSKQLQISGSWMSD